MRPIAATRCAAAAVAHIPAPSSSAIRIPAATLAALALALVVTGCEQFRPYIPTSEGHIGTGPAKPAPDSAIPPPARTSDFVPAPKAAAKPQTYSVVVNEVPVKDLLLALARDTKQNIDIHSGITGLVSLNAIDETLPAILERVSKQVNMRYRLEGNTIIVSPDSPYVKTYRVNYVNMSRDTTSSIGVTGEIGASSGTPGAGGGGGAGASGSSTTVRTVSKNDFWDQIRDNIRSILNSTRLQSLTAEAKAEHLMRVKQDQDNRAKQIEAASRAGAGAPNLASATISAPSGSQSSLVPDDVIVNPVSGTITINATERQHQLVQTHIDSIVSAMQRQVLIEATIVEVLLNNNYQGGIDWARLSQSGGFSISQSVIAGRLPNPPFVTMLYNPLRDFNRSNFNVQIKLLEQFGNARVLSSPKLMALNNQTALLKVVDNIVYFEVRADTSTTQGAQTQTVNTTAKTVAVGLVMAVTPQINEDGRVFLTVRPTITRLRPDSPFVSDPNPTLANPCGPVNPCPQNAIQNQVPQVQTREMESVLQVGSGQVVILGGLMQDDVRRNRDQIPGADRAGVFGELLRFRDEQVNKTELVIFIRPIVVANPSLNSDELNFFQRFLPKPEAPPPPERTGAAR